MSHIAFTGIIMEMCRSTENPTDFNHTHKNTWRASAGARNLAILISLIKL